VKIGRRKRDWPRFERPELQAELTVLDVLRTEAGMERDEMIMQWAGAVWQSWEDRHAWVKDMTGKVLYEEGK
jgi:Family of unknown function (DUF5946)